MTGEDGAGPLGQQPSSAAPTSGTACSYYYASFIDMDRQVAAEQELLRDKQLYEDASRSPPGSSSGPTARTRTGPS
jgi:hypothetical protein